MRFIIGLVFVFSVSSCGNSNSYHPRYVITQSHEELAAPQENEPATPEVH